MFAEKFEYHAPASLQEAASLLGQHGEDAKIVTGGMSLIPLMKLRLAAPSHLIDLRKLNDLKGVSESGGKIVIGARTTYSELAGNALLRSKCPLVCQAAAEVGDVQVRNRGTIGGSLVHADPAADLPAAAMALDAEISLGGRQSRTVKVADFIVDALSTSIAADEILVSVSVPATGPKTCYLKMAQHASGFALVGVAVVLDMEGNTCRSARIGVTGVSAKAFRAATVEQALAGKALDAGTIKAAAEQIAADIRDPLEDPLNGSAAYRAQLAKVYTARAVQGALAA